MTNYCEKGALSSANDEISNDGKVLGGSWYFRRGMAYVAYGF